MNIVHSARRGWLVAAVLLAAAFVAAPAAAKAEYITVASTTSTQNSGLFGHILPLFTKATGIEVRVVAVGTGAAIRLARAGDADVLLVHHKASEEAFVASGFGARRHPFMYNDFILVGPNGDPAGVKTAGDVIAALKRVEVRRSVFLSRGDGSGTHKRERELWATSGIDPSLASGTWYRETGSGMGATLNVAAAMNGYTLTDRGTWLGFANKQDLAIVHQGDSRLRNEYGVILVSQERHPHVKAKAGQAFIDWLTSATGKAAIDSYRIKGERLFKALR